MITVDNAITTEAEGFIGTDNVKAGEQAGVRMCELLTDKGQKNGKILHESSASGQQVLVDRFNGFKSGLAAKCPDAQIIQTSVNDNDLNKAVSQVNDALTATPDLAGVFADNNTSGTGAAKAVAERNAGDRVAVVAFDSDPAEIAGVRDGSIDAIIVQNPFFFGYQGVVEAAMAIGEHPAGPARPGRRRHRQVDRGRGPVRAVAQPAQDQGLRAGHGNPESSPVVSLRGVGRAIAP